MITAQAPHTVSVIGLGLMGSALAECLLEAGHAVTVWNRSAAKAKPLIAGGARHAASPAEAVSASDVTIICLTNHATAMEVLVAASPAEDKTDMDLAALFETLIPARANAVE